MCLLVFKTSVGRVCVPGEFDSHTPSPEYIGYVRFRVLFSAASFFAYYKALMLFAGD